MARKRNRRPKRPTPDGPARAAGGKQRRKDRPAPTARLRKRRLTGWRKWALRGFLVVLGPLLALGVLEGALRLFGYGDPTGFFVKIEGRDAYTTSDKFAWRFFPPALARPNLPCSLPKEKAPGTFRIFVLGGSAALGTPDTTFAFARILEVMLRERFPGARFEIFNTAMVAINSHVVLPIARECADHEPDLYVVYLGNNEVVGPYGAGTVLRSFSPNLTLIRAGIRIRATKTGQLLERLVTAVSGRGQQFHEWKGMQMFMHNRVPADDRRLEAVYRHFRTNLTDICRAGTRAGAKVVVCTVATNLADCPPFASMHRSGLAQGDLARWERIYREGIALEEAGNHEGAAERYLQTAAIDDRFAELHFRLARCHLRMGNPDKARAAFGRARDLDALRFRCDTRINDTIREVAGGKESQGIHLVDGMGAFERSGETSHGIPGRELLYEHVHLNFDGHYVLACELFRKVVAILPEEIRKRGPASPAPLPQEQCEALLALTGADRYQMATHMFSLVREPPFTNQLDHEAEMARWRRRLAELKVHTSPEALAKARAIYRNAIDRAPDDLWLHNNLARLEYRRGDYAAAAEQYRWLLERIPGEPSWTCSLADALQEQGKLADAVEKYREAIRRKADHLEARMGLAAALRRLRRPDAAEREYRELLRIRPHHAAAHLSLGQLLLGQGRTGDAVAAFRSAVQSKPDLLPARVSLIEALVSQGRARETAPHVQEAVGQLRTAVRDKPDWVQGKATLAWYLATADDPAVRSGPEAVRLATEANRAAGGRSFMYLDALAAAYAETGQFDQAVAAAAEALRLAQSARQDTAAIRKRLDLYQRRLPYRQGVQ